VKFRAKPVAASGVITGLFLYTGQMDSQQHDEIDIEFLGNDTTRVQLNYYINGIGKHEVVIPLSFDASSAFHDYEIEWLPSSITWYVDGVQKHIVTGKSGVTIPSFAQHIFVNVWATIGVPTWAGKFVYANQPLTASVDLVTYIPAVGSTANTGNTGAGGGGCVLATSDTFDPTFILMCLFFIHC